MEELTTSGRRRLVVKVGGDFAGAWARAVPGVTISRVEGGAARLVLDEGTDPQAVLAAAMAAGPVEHFGVRETAALRGLPRGAGVKYVIIGVVVALLALRLWRRTRVRRRLADSSGPDTTARPPAAGARPWTGSAGTSASWPGARCASACEAAPSGSGRRSSCWRWRPRSRSRCCTRDAKSREHVGIVGTLSAPLRATVLASGPAVGTAVTLVPEAVPGRGPARPGGGTRRPRARRHQPDRRRTSRSTPATPRPRRCWRASSRPRSACREASSAPASRPTRPCAWPIPAPLPVQSLQRPRHNETGRTTAVYGLILTYVLLAQFGTWLLMGVVEEKSSRVIEVLLSTLRAGQLLAGKVIGIGVVALLQAGLIVGVALGLGAAEGSTLIHGTASLGIVSSLLWVVLGYAFYCWVYAAGGSLADRQEQVQSLAFPLQLPILFGYIVSFTALGSGQPSELVKVLAYLPPTAPFAMPVLVGPG